MVNWRSHSPERWLRSHKNIRSPIKLQSTYFISSQLWTNVYLVPGKWTSNLWLLGDQLRAEDVDLWPTQELLHGVDDLPGPGHQTNSVVSRGPPQRHLKPGRAWARRYESAGDNLLRCQSLPPSLRVNKVLRNLSVLKHSHRSLISSLSNKFLTSM